MVSSKLVHISTLKGDEGKPGPAGPTGTFAGASAVSVPADAPARAIMAGPQTARTVTFEIPRGLPGAADVPTDEAVATILAAVDSDSRAAVAAMIAGLAGPESVGAYRIDLFPGRTQETVSINNRTYSTTPLVVLPGGDYVCAWFNENREPVVGRFNPTTRSWQTVNLALLGGNPMGSPAPNDGHNSLVIIRDGLGYLHIAGNHHANNLRMVRSSAPDDISAWKTVNTGAEPLWNPLTYPTFGLAPNGDVLFFFRNGYSGTGDWYLQRWVVSSQSWSTPVQIFSGRFLTPGYSAYPNSMVVDGSDIHLFFMWRPAGTESASDNWDFSYIVSRDEGATWQTVSGTSVALPVAPTTSTGKFITGNHRYMNQCGATLDEDGHPHAVVRHQPTSGPWQVRHIFWDGSAWVDELVTTGTAGTVGRPNIALAAGELFVFFRRGARARGLKLSSGVEFDVFPYDLGATEAGWEPALDPTTIAVDGVLRVIVSSTVVGASNDPAPVGPGGFGGIVTMQLTDAVIGTMLAGRALAGSPGVPTVPVPSAAAPRVPSENIISLGNVTTSPWFATGGERWQDTGTAPILPVSRNHVARVAFARTGAISAMAVKVVTAAAAGSVQGVLADEAGVVLARTAQVSVSTVGNKTLAFQDSGGNPFSPQVVAGRVYLLGVVIWGGTGCALMLTRVSDPDVGGSAVASVLDNVLTGLRNTADQTAGAATLGTLSASPLAPVIAVQATRNL